MNSPTGICCGYLDGISVMRSSFELEKMGSESLAHKTEPPIAFVCSLIKFLFLNAWLCVILNNNFLGHERGPCSLA